MLTPIRSLRSRPTRASLVLLASALCGFSAVSGRAANIVRNATVAPLNDIAAWGDGLTGVPGIVDVAVFNSTSNNSTANPESLTANLELGGIYVSSAVPGTSANITAAAPVTLTLARSNATAGDYAIDLTNGGSAATSKGLTLGSNITVSLSANQTWAIGHGTGSSANVIVNGPVVGSGSLTLVRGATATGTPANTLRLAGANTFSGGFTLESGIMDLGNSAAFIASSGNITSGPFGTGPLTIRGGTLSALSTRPFFHPTVNILGDFTWTTNSRTDISGSFDFGGAQRTATLTRSTSAANVIIGGGNLAIRFAPQTGTPTTNSFANGGIRFASTATTGNYSVVGFGLSTGTTTGSNRFVDNASLTIGPGAYLVATGTGAPFGALATEKPAVTIEAGGWYSLSDGGTGRGHTIFSLSGAGTVLNNGGNTTVRTDTLTIDGGVKTGTYEFSGIIRNTDTATFGGTANPNLVAAITKTGNTVQILSGANTYTGNTTVNGGKLVTTTASTNGAYVVGTGATLGVRVHAAGADLNVTGLTLAASTLEFDLGALGNPTAAVVNNSGNTTLSGAVTVNIVGNSATLAPGSFNLVTTAGTRSGAGSFTLGALPLGVSATLAETGANLVLTVTSVNPVYQWTGATNAVWDLSSGNLNWTLGGAASAYADAPSRDVVLDDSATGPAAINLPGAVSPKALLVNSSTLAYSLSGTGRVTGSGGLTKSGSSVLTVSTANDYAGATLVDAGTLRLAASGVLPDGAGKSGVTVNGVLDLAGFNETVNGLAGTGSVTSSSTAATLTVGGDNASSSFGGALGGPVTLAKTGSGTLTLSGVNTLSGGVSIASGGLTLGADGTTGSLPAALAIANNGTLTINRSNNTAQGTDFGLLTGSGALVKSGGSATTLVLNQANTYAGLTTVGGGNLTIAAGGALGSTAAGTVVANGASLVLSDGVTIAGESLTLTGLGNGQRGALRVASGNATWAGNVTINNAGFEVRLAGSVAAGGTLSITGVISGGDSTGITATASGYRPTVVVRSDSVTDTAVLSGASTFAGDFAVWAGRVRLAGGDNRLPTTARLVASSFIAGQANRFDLNGVNQQLAGLADADAANSSGALTTVTNDSATPSVLTLAHSDNTTFSGPVGGNLALVKSGAGTAALTGAISYSGDTTVSGGVLALAQSGLADGADVRLSGGVLALNFAGTDTVRSLYIGGVQQPAGVYGASGSGATTVDAAFAGTGTLTVSEGPAADPFASWASGFGLTGPSAAADADPDADGSANLLEWILGGNPTVADAAADAPQLVKDATHLNLVFDRADATESAVALVARWGVDLAAWNNVSVGASSSGPDANGVTVTVVENGSAADTVTVSVPLARAVGGRLFLNLRATKN